MYYSGRRTQLDGEKLTCKKIDKPGRQMGTNMVNSTTVVVAFANNKVDFGTAIFHKMENIFIDY